MLHTRRDFSHNGFLRFSGAISACTVPKSTQIVAESTEYQNVPPADTGDTLPNQTAVSLNDVMCTEETLHLRLSFRYAFLSLE
jgi:hypothetical protein